MPNLTGVDLQRAIAERKGLPPDAPMPSIAELADDIAKRTGGFSSKKTRKGFKVSATISVECADLRTAVGNLYLECVG